MRRREFIALFGASVTWPFAALAQEPGRMYRLGMLMPFPRDAPVNLRLLEELRKRGFIEGPKPHVRLPRFRAARRSNFEIRGGAS
jgi:hypothetical protein